MSPFDITRLSPTMPLREVGGGQNRAPSQASAQRGADHADKGVAVRTDAAISAGAPRVDTDRVSEIREALRDGSYPIVPAKITDAIIAARLMLSGGQ